ncbi:MAG TPA: dimethyl sulfoxide reductase anchor subunit [Rhodospirillales bacterium]|nr:dimethyl sulfoxide reductase anchor subunit [Rhodospirillales bacterium]
MHPALSIILFTTSSGAGYGMLFLLGLGAALGLLPTSRGFGLAACGLALGFVTFGLVSSTFHLGHPERAWRAFSQWRSSWLSREAVAAVATYLPALLLALGWTVAGDLSGAWRLVALLTALGAAGTVFCTAMIYRSLRAVPRWHSPWTVPGYLLYALVTGGAWLLFLFYAFGETPPTPLLHGLPSAVIAAWLVQWAAWRRADRGTPVATVESATGLGGRGPVRLLDPPHSETNYLLREMAFRIGRRHAAKLRRVTVVSAFALPLALGVLLPFVGRIVALPASLLAALSMSLGVLVERWLFFAEARHTVTLYYGARAVG